MKIAFLIHNAYGIGGTIRATGNLASALAARHDVEIVSVYRGADTPQLPPGPGVRLVPLIDIRKDTGKGAGRDLDHELQREPSALLPGGEASLTAFTRLADERVAAYLAATDADVVVATRPGLVVYLARLARERGFLRIGQEHLIHGSHPPAVREAQDAAIPLLDAYTTVSEGDAATHRAHLPGVRTPVVALPNAVPAPPVEPSSGDARLVVAAGRLIPVKRYPLLVEAFAKVVAERPDWRLRIYGRGPEHAALRERIDRLGLSDHVFLMGPHSPIETEWAKGAVAAVASDYESFGMTIVEAMHCGVPVVATNCPHGPGEIITDGEDGLLVPTGDADALAAGLLALIDDPALRHTMGTAARESAKRYTPARVAERFEDLVRTLRDGAQQGTNAPPDTTTTPTGPTPTPATPARPNNGTTPTPHDNSGAPGPSADATAAPTARTATVHPLRRTARRLLRVLRRRAGTPTPPPTTTPNRAAAPPVPAPLKPLRPRAHARATVDGGLAVRFPRAGVSGQLLTLVGTLRGTDGTAARQRVELPLVADAATGDLTAVLTRTNPLAEGRWDFRVERADDGKRARVGAAYVEQARLLALPLREQEGHVTAWVPYATAGGGLTLRTWRRPAHAELDRIEAGPEALTLTATAHGTAVPLGEHGTLVALPPRDGAEPVELPVTVLDERRLTCTLPYETLTGSTETVEGAWRLRLRPAPGAALVPLGRLAGDNVDRKRTDVYPAGTLPSPLRGTVTVRPVFDPENDLTVDVRPTPKIPEARKILNVREAPDASQEGRKCDPTHNVG
ncbi:glycosyltransferase [Streptomyces gamaensis]|uniref:D-inositol 3-phosphate glycosyltransferase n=1 Tax=Streptomyces gamaensis TaxID=1763542 RepID=A0ABW0Z2Y2_9ACTN